MFDSAGPRTLFSRFSGEVEEPKRARDEALSSFRVDVLKLGKAFNQKSLNAFTGGKLLRLSLRPAPDSPISRYALPHLTPIDLLGSAQASTLYSNG